MLMTSIFTRFFALILILLLNFFLSRAQTYRYTIHHGDDEIGEITASHTSSGPESHFKITSTAVFKVLWKYNRKTSMAVRYKNGVLEYSSSEVFMNDELEERCQIKKNREVYDCRKQPGDSFQIKSPIVFSSARLYFEEPIGVEAIFLESYLAFCPLEPMGNHKYKLTLPGEKVNYYTYENEILKEIFVERSWFDIIFRKKE